MSSYKIAVYPQDKYRFELYDNVERLTWQEIQRRTGCCALVNLWYFALKDIPSAGVKAYDHQAALMLGGKWACPPTFGWPGICIDQDGRVTTAWDKDATWSYAASVQADYIGGKRTNTTAWARNGVTYTGIKGDGSVVCLLASRDAGLTGEEAVAAMLEAGCVDILRWDGSWSSQGSLGPGMDVQPSQKRICRGWLLVFPREDKKEEDQPMDGITTRYMTKNDCYKAGKTIKPQGIMVHSTAAPGVMAEALRGQWDKGGVDKAVHAMVDDKGVLQTLPWDRRGWHAGTGTSGRSANDTHIAFEVCEPDMCRLLPIEWAPLKRGSTGWAVQRLQMELQARGHDPKGVDGSFGPGCEAALKACQRALGLTADGSCGPATLAALAKRTGSCLAYTPTETETYFRAVWGRAVALCTKLCKEHGLDPMRDILCHSEGYKAGVASNHADVMHWWPRHGEDMDTFRAAVRAAMEGESAPDYRDKVQERFGLDSATVEYLAAYQYGADLLRKLATAD